MKLLKMMIDNSTTRSIWDDTRMRFICHKCGKGAHTVSDAENIYATCEDEECEFGNA